METSYKPEGYNSASPYFIVNDADRFVDLMKRIFDAEELRRFENPDGTIMHAEIRIDDSVIMLSEATEEYKPFPVVMHVYVPDSDLTFARAIEAGCESIQEPKNSEDDPDRRGSFSDFAGNWWSVGTQRSSS